MQLLRTLAPKASTDILGVPIYDSLVRWPVEMHGLDVHALTWQFVPKTLSPDLALFTLSWLQMSKIF